MQALWNAEFDYQPHRHAQGRNRSHCLLQVFKGDDGKALVIATELRDNPGMSITNSSEALATLVVNHFELDPAQTTFIEHYNDQVSYGTDHLPHWPRDSHDKYAVATYTWTEGDVFKTAKHPQWKYISEEEYQLLLGGFTHND